MKKIYIAGPFFSDIERMKLIKVIELLKTLEDYELFIPMEHFIPNGENMSNKDWAKEVYEMDKQALENSDIVVALYNGLYSDTGTAWEIGYATALNKKLLIIVTSIKVSIMPINCATICIYYSDFIHLKFDENIINVLNQK